jgi:D-xylulose reductase
MLIHPRAMAAARALGARNILAVDVNAERLEFAKQYAATHSHLAVPMLPGQDLASYSERHVRYHGFISCHL